MAELAGISANLNAFLDMIAYSEIGPDILAKSDDGYNVIVGSTPKKLRLFYDYSDHPRVKVDLHHLAIWSTAAGRYQILQRYFDAYKKQLNLPDFSPESQDKIAIQLIRECNALDEIEVGQFLKALHLCRSRWASFPDSGYGQGENKTGDLIKAYIAAGGSVVPDGAERFG
jgi:muramidase (phage lysozyme)